MTKRFGKLFALSDVSLDIAPGEIHCILGENGAGKSTLCNLVFGVHAPDAGTMQFRGAPYKPAAPADALASGIAMVHQHFSLVGDMTVVDNVLLGQARGVLNRRACARRLRAAPFRMPPRPVRKDRGPVGRRTPARRDRKMPDARAAPVRARRADR